MEFDKSKILTVVTGNKELEGKFGWFGDTPTEIKENMRKEKPEKLLSFDEACSCPFEAHYFFVQPFLPRTRAYLRRASSTVDKRE